MYAYSDTDAIGYDDDYCRGSETFNIYSTHKY